MILLRAALLPALLALAACSGGGTGAGPATAGPLPPAPSGRTPSPASPGPAVPTPSALDDEAPALVLQGGGLGLVEGDADVQPLPFGVPAAAVREVVEAALGPTLRAPLPDCLQGPRTALLVQGFTVLLDGEVFVGWRDSGTATDAVTTADGVGVGARLPELLSALPDVQVVPVPEGAAWSSPSGLWGLLSGTGPDAVLTVIAGGQVCALPPGARLPG